LAIGKKLLFVANATDDFQKMENRKKVIFHHLFLSVILYLTFNEKPYEVKSRHSLQFPGIEY